MSAAQAQAQAAVKKSWRGISAAQVEPFLAELLPLLRRIDYDTLTLDAMLYHVSQRSLQLWVYGPFEGVLITEIVHHQRFTVLSLRYGAGKFSRDWIKSGREVVLPWAKRYGCTKIEVAGRPGWAKLFKLKPAFTLYRGDI